MLRHSIDKDRKENIMVVKVGDLPAAIPLQPKKEAQKTEKKGSFRKAVLKETTSSGETEKTSSVQGASPLAGLMHLQEIDESSKQAFFKRSEALLSHLEIIRQGLLLGSFSKKELEEIRSDLSSSQVPESFPEGAKETCDLIEQRVHIELAKLEMSS